MYVCTLFRVQNHEKLEKGCVSLIFTNLRKDMGGIKKKHAKIRVYFHTWKMRALGVFWKSFYKADIHPEIQVAPWALFTYQQFSEYKKQWGKEGHVEPSLNKWGWLRFPFSKTGNQPLADWHQSLIIKSSNN